MSFIYLQLNDKPGELLNCIFYYYPKKKIDINTTCYFYSVSHICFLFFTKINFIISPFKVAATLLKCY